MNIILNGQVIEKRVTIEFLELVQIQGSGFLDEGTGGAYNGYVRWTGGNTFTKQNCAVAANGTCAMAMQTGATSRKEDEQALTGMVVNRIGGGTKVYVESLNREIRINDIGGIVDKHQIDVYTGLEGGQTDLGFPGNHHSRVWGLVQKE